MNISFNVNVNSPYTYNVIESLRVDEGIENKGIFLKTEHYVSVQLKIGYGNNGDAVRVLKVLENSNEFVVAAYDSSSISSQYKDNIVSVVATEDDTNVQIIEFDGESSQIILHQENLRRYSLYNLV